MKRGAQADRWDVYSGDWIVGALNGLFVADFVIDGSGWLAFGKGAIGLLASVLLLRAAGFICRQAMRAWRAKEETP